MTPRLNYLKVIVATAAAVLLSTLAAATTMVEVNLAKIVDNTEKAFLGTVQKVEVVETKDGWAERVTFTVDEAIFNVRADETVTWNQARMGKDFRFPGMPQYQAGEQHAIFLAGKGRGSDLQAPYALGQASFRAKVVPETGEVLLMNQFQNKNLTKGLDGKGLAEEIVASDAQSRNVVLSADEQRQKAEETHGQLMSVSSGSVSFTQLKDVANSIRKIDNAAERFAVSDDQQQRPRVIMTEDADTHDHK